MVCVWRKPFVPCEPYGLRFDANHWFHVNQMVCCSMRTIWFDTNHMGCVWLEPCWSLLSPSLQSHAPDSSSITMGPEQFNHVFSVTSSCNEWQTPPSLLQLLPDLILCIRSLSTCCRSQPKQTWTTLALTQIRKFRQIRQNLIVNGRAMSPADKIMHHLPNNPTIH